MRILIANPPSILEGQNYCRAGARWPSKKTLYEDYKDIGRYTPFPFFLAYTSALLKGDTHNMFVIDASTLLMRDEEFFSEIEKRKPIDVVIIETATPTINYDLQYAKKIKEATGAKIVFVGSHVSVFPEQMLKNDFIDFVAIGEYEYIVKELVQKLETRQNISKIKGLGYKFRGVIKINERRPLIEPLDSLPYPDRDSFPIDTQPDFSVYWDGFCEIYPALQMVSTRGCPFNCDYCLWTQVMYPGRKYRMFSAKRVVDEMELLINKYNAKEIYFDDDTFTANKKHVLEICDEINKRKIKIPWCAMADCMISDREMVEAMAKAGCIALKFGVESIVPEVLKKIDKPITIEKVLQFAKWCREFKIRSHATFCFGMIGDTLETMQKTLDFACRLDVDSVQFSRAIPYPGTRFFNLARSEGWLKENNWSNYDGRALVSYPDLSAQQIEKFHKKSDEIWKKAKIKDSKWVLRRIIRTYNYRGIGGVIYLFKRAKRYL